MTAMSTMKAAIRTGWTGFTLTFSNKQPVPNWDAEKKNSDDVYIQVHAAAMNPVDYKLPRILAGPVFGIDCCGKVTKVGVNAASSFQVGDVVVGAAKLPYAGSMADYSVAEASKVAKLPEGWTVEEGAAVPTAYDTALTGFTDAGILQKYKENPDKPPVESILVIGASGGCGTAALQLAKGMRIPRIIGICSSKNAKFCTDNGASEVVAYDDSGTMEAFLKNNAGKIDVVYDSASGSGGGEKYSQDPKIFALLKEKDGGDKKASYLVLNGPAHHWLRNFILGSPTSDPRLAMVLTKHSTEDLSLAMELIGKAKLKPVLDSSVELSEEGVKEGYAKLKSRRAKGKIVVNVSPAEATK